MSVNPVQVLISNVFIESWVDQDLSWSYKQHECVVVEICERQLSAETTKYHVGRKNKEGDQGSVKESLSCLAQSHLDLISMLKQQVANSRKVFHSNVHNCLEISWLSFHLEICTQISFVDHKLVLRSRHNRRSVLSFSNKWLCNLEQLLFLKWWDFRTKHHVRNVS